MLFPTFEFLLIFFPIVFLLHESRFFNARLTWQLALLTVASLIFSSIWEARSFYIIFAMLLANLLVIQFLIKKPSKRWLIIGILVNLLPLAYFKYTNFILGNLGIHLTPKELAGLSIASLPLAISFYSFVALTYIVDAYKRKITEHSPLNYSFFVTFFPHLIAGPIVHHRDLIPQIGIKKDRAALFYEGMFYLGIGFCKKIFLADPVGSFVDNIYTAAADGSMLTFLDSLSATLGYTFQIYFDFSGYSDMAVGLGLLLGYRLPVNFISPYKSTSITDFWRRWHITLSRLMREYIYFSLGGNRKGKLRQCANVMVTMLVSGLWHGAGWTFVLWGGLHGIIMVFEKAAEHLFEAIKVNLTLPRAVKIACTFVVVNLLWILFRAEHIDIAQRVYAGLLSPSQMGSFEIAHWKFIFAGFVLVALPNSHEVIKFIITRKEQYKYFFWNNARKAAPGCLLGVGICLLSLYLFYSTSFDRYIYANLPVERFSLGIDNKVADYRSNIFSSPLFTHEESKVAIVGSSFTAAAGHFVFPYKEEAIYSSTLGMGGNYLSVGLRSATAIIDTQGLKVLVLGVSPINYSEESFKSTQPFKGQLYEGFQLLNIENPSDDKYSSAQPTNPSLLDLCVLFIRSSARFQFREFLFKVATGFKLTSFNKNTWEESINYTAYTPEKVTDLSLFLQRKIDPLGQPPGSTNGNDRKMKWESRGALESLAPEGKTYKALVNLDRLCKTKGIRFILYTTPTVSHKDAPDIYPEGFYEKTQAAVFNIAQSNNIEYYDFSFAFPWDAAYMVDFIHPTIAAREVLHKYLINIITAKGEI